MDLLLIFIALAAGIVTIGYSSYQGYEQRHRVEVERQLSAIADLKVGELVQVAQGAVGGWLRILPERGPLLRGATILGKAERCGCATPASGLARQIPGPLSV